MDAGKMDQMSWLKECAAIGLDGVELLNRHFPSTDADYLAKVKKACQDQYLTIAMVSAGGHLSVSDDAKRAEEVADIERWTDVAHFLGAPCVRFFCGSSKELDAGGKPLYDKVVQAIRQIVAKGQKYGITMALENHGGTRADQLLSLMKDVDSPYLRFTLDTGNFPPTSQVGPDTYSSIQQCAPSAAIVHAKFFNVNADGTDAEFDWHKIHSILQGAGFNGFMSIEYEGKDADEPATVKRVAKFLRTLR